MAAPISRRLEEFAPNYQQVSSQTLESDLITIANDPTLTFDQKKEIFCKSTRNPLFNQAAFALLKNSPPTFSSVILSIPFEVSENLFSFFQSFDRDTWIGSYLHLLGLFANTESYASLCSHLIDLLPEHFRCRLPEFVNDEAKARTLGLILSTHNDAEMTQTSLRSYFCSNRTQKEYQSLFQGLKDGRRNPLGIPEGIEFILNDELFEEWMNAHLLISFWEYPVPIQAMLFLGMNETSQVNFLSIYGESLDQIFPLWVGCADFPAEIEIRLNCCRIFVDNLRETGLQMFVDKSCSHVGATKWVPLFLAAIKLTDLQELTCSIARSTGYSLLTYEERSLIDHNLKSTGKLAHLCENIETAVEVHVGAQSRDEVKNPVEVGKYGVTLPFQRPQDCSNIDKLKIEKFIATLPPLFCTFAAMANYKGMQSDYMEFLPYMSEEQLLHFAKSLNMEDQEAVNKFLRCCQLISMEKYLLILAHLEQPMFAKVLDSCLNLVRRIVTDLRETHKGFLVEAEAYWTIAEKKGSEFEKLHKFISEKVFEMENLIRMGINNLTLAMSEFAKATPTFTDNLHFKLLIGLIREMHAISKLINDPHHGWKASLHKDKPVQLLKRSREDNKPFREGFYRDISIGSLERLGFQSFAELTCVGICCEKDLDLLGNDPKKGLRAYMEQGEEELKGFWTYLKSKEFDSITKLFDMFIVEKAEDLFDLEKIVSKIKSADVYA